jgi:hypothetical protein
MACCIQIKGGFFSEAGLAAAVEAAAERLSNGLVNQPLPATKRQTEAGSSSPLAEQAAVAAA